MILQATNITKQVKGPDGKVITILKNIDLTVKNSDFMAILGPSGSGKTTLLQILGLMDSQSTGELTFKGVNTSTYSKDQKADIRANNIGFIFQKPLLINDLTLEENIIIANKVSSKKINPEYFSDILEKVGLINKRKHYPNMLSMGEAQRASLARAIINQPDIIFADEPTASLDKENKLLILDLLKKFNQNNGITIVLASHDQVILDYNKSLLHLNNGMIEYKALYAN